MLEIICLEHIDHIAKTYDLQLQYLVYMIILCIYIYNYINIMVLSKPGSPAADPERGPDKPFSSASEMDLDGYHGWASWMKHGKSRITQTM